MKAFSKLAVVAALGLISAGAFAADITDVRVDDIYQQQGGSNNVQSMDVGNTASKAQNGKTSTHVYAHSLRQFQSGNNNVQAMRIGNNSGTFATTTESHVTLGNVVQSQSGNRNRQYLNVGNVD